MNASIIQKFFVDGPAGRLETILAEPKSKPCGIAIIAHPHPLYGGTMDNKVVYTLFNTLLELDLITVKFNFRGVGNSAGIYDNGIGEVDDVVTITRTICNQFNNQLTHLPLLLAGFSFGGAIQAHAAQHLNPQHLILVAPSVANLNAPLVHNQARHILVIHGDQDDVVPLQTVLDWATPQSLAVEIIPGAEHFFHGQLTALKQTILRSHQL